MREGRKSPPAQFRFSLRRMLLLMALASVCLAGFRTLSEAWSVWLATAAFYLATVLLFVPSAGRKASHAQAAE